MVFHLARINPPAFWESIFLGGSPFVHPPAGFVIDSRLLGTLVYLRKNIYTYLGDVKQPAFSLG